MGWQLAIDFEASRLYWACGHIGDNRIQSSNMHGRDKQTVIQTRGGSWTWGVGLLGNRVYFTNFNTMTLQSVTKAGNDIRVLHNGTTEFYGLAVVPTGFNVTRYRNNHCENKNCQEFRVLTPTSYKCLPFEFQQHSAFNFDKPNIYDWT